MHTCRKENRKSRHRSAGFEDRLLDVAVVADVFFAVAVVAFAAGTIPEFQFRIADIRSSADGAAVGVGGFFSSSVSFLVDSVEGDDFCFSDRSGILGEFPLCLDPPGQGQHVQHIGTEEQEVVGQGDYREQIVGEGIGDQIHQHNGQIEQCEDPGLHRNNEEQQELCIREQGGVAQEQTQIQLSDAGSASKDHAVNVHHQHAGQIEQIEPQGSPYVFHSLSQ